MGGVRGSGSGASARSTAVPLLPGCGVDKRLSPADDWTSSGDVQSTKPQPDLVEAAMEKAGDGDAVMFRRPRLLEDDTFAVDKLQGGFAAPAA